MRTLATIIHGSHLFGTATENSDVDRKSVVVPNAFDIALGRIDRSWAVNTKIDARARNSPDDEDHEFHDLMRFVNLLTSGQPVAIEMLFAPDRFHEVVADPVWNLLRENTDRIVSKEAGKFLGYARRQAVVYGVKGDRLRSAEMAAEVIESIVERVGRKERIATFLPEILERLEGVEFVTTETRVMEGGREMNHLSVCNRLVAVTANTGTASDLLNALVREYGKRAQAAKEAGGHDWKALSHSVRIGYEAVELFETGRLTLPSPLAPRLLDIKLGLVDREEVQDEIVGLLGRVEAAAATSPLPEKADISFLEGVVARTHIEEIMACEPILLPTP